MGLEGLRFEYQPKPMVHTLSSFYNMVRFVIAGTPKLFEFYATQPNRQKVTAAVALADQLWAEGAPEQAVYLSLVRTYLKAMGGLKPAAGVKDWQPRYDSRAVEALKILAERMDYFIEEGGYMDTSIIATWRDLIRITLEKES